MDALSIAILYGIKYDKPILGVNIKRPDKCADCIYKSWTVCPCKCKGEKNDI